MFAQDKKMNQTIIWEQASNNPDNADNLAKIANWWSNLNGKNVEWKQRLIPSSGDLSEINWEENQRFDEKFNLQLPQLRGITLYWRKDEVETERNITARRLELDSLQENLLIYPQSQPQVIIRVSFPQPTYKTIEIRNPQIVGKIIGDNCLLLLRDKQQKIEIKLLLDSQAIAQLKENLPD